MSGKWARENMDYEKAKEIVSVLMHLCGSPDFKAQHLIPEHEREDCEEAIRVVLEYLP